MTNQSKVKVLIADDDPITRMLLTRNLSSWGYLVFSAQDGEQAWKIVKSEPELRLFIIDWSMPKLNGLEFCQCLKNEQDFFHYIIMLTGKKGTENIVEAMSNGVDDFVTKPFVADELRVRLKVGERIIEQEKRLEFYANKDSLTGAWNRRMILNHLKEEWERATRDKSLLGVVLFDLDFFKNINDSYGHQIGDDALKVFCSIIQGNIRPYDKLGRYGGEEFLLILPNSDDVKAFQIAERCRKQIEKLKMPISGHNPITITASAGVAVCDAGKPSIHELFKQCDVALYQAKQQGRNQIVLAKPTGD
ncbi:response regulator receiver protein [Catenovulum agarivorans DS-2]|uniref:diguanylate cyclase n=1 Tax=Catenovulum agarivorans DS-2 TaxID=1328313 RepID=W7QBE8_9ALTE|nr:diguanylate cyclase [Catenovulum agarivorans]EWH10119.1 response regulator receiver protein [Catenovulum agarivorans DS-2]